MHTRTSPEGYIHAVEDNTTLCGLNAVGWSTAITRLQQLGLVVHCYKCDQEVARRRIEGDK